MANEADTCRKYVLPKLYTAGWDDDQISEQRTFTDGRIMVTGTKVWRRSQKRADYLLRYTHDFPIAVVEAKAEYKTPGAGLQQAKDYAETLGMKFAYSTNGHGVIEFDYLSGKESELDGFPSPKALWSRLQTKEGITDDAAGRLFTPSHRTKGKILRYYQEIAVNRAVQAILQGKPRILLTMATGTGKTDVAFQVCWKLWNSRWNRANAYRHPKILYLADRLILVDDPKDKIFAPFGDARHRIENGQAVKSRDIYFATYQAIAEDERRPGLYREYASDFFDLIIVDECHRGSARDESAWREILEYFEPACQLGMTATPLREENRDTYHYFGNPLYTYSLRQGIEDGFLAPYRVNRVVTTCDATGWRPSAGEIDRYGREIPDGLYGTGDFERVVALKARTEAIARHLADFMKKDDRLAKTIVFCVDQEHAEDMRRALNNLNTDLVKQHPDYVCRVTSDEGSVGRGHCSRFQELETVSPVILTTSQLLSTGIDAPTCKNIVLARVIGSMVEFKQIIGRGTRVRDDYDKYFFNILDYTGAATKHFADPDFDGEPVLIAEEEIDNEGRTLQERVLSSGEAEELDEEEQTYEEAIRETAKGTGLRKYYVDRGYVEIAADLVYELDADGKQLRIVKYGEYTAEKLKQLYPTAAALRKLWAKPRERAKVISGLADRGIDFERLALVTKQSEADPLDLLCHVAYSAPLRTRRERADRIQKEEQSFFEKYAAEARTILNELLDKYTEHGTAQFAVPQILKVPPISDHGNVMEIASFFGGTEQLKEAVNQLQELLYAA